MVCNGYSHFSLYICCKSTFQNVVFVSSCLSESSINKSCKVTDAYKLFLNGILLEDPFPSTLLGSFIEPSPRGKVSFYANSHRLNNSSARKPIKTAIQVKLHLSGNIRLGPLKFPNMSIDTEIHSDEFRTCGSHRLSIPGLNLSATSNQQKTLGKFFTCSSSDSLQIILRPDSENRSGGVLNTTVTLLGNSFKAQVTIFNSSLKFEKELELFDRYRLLINGSSNLQAWDFLSLKVVGTFHKSNNNIVNNALENEVNDMINDYINVVVKNTFQRLESLQKTGNKMRKRIDRSKSKLVQAENNTHLAIKRYLWALKAEQAATRGVERAEKMLTNSSQKLDQLKASLKRLCSVIECPYTCVAGTACNTCYQDLISKEQGVCSATCHNVIKERLPPFQEESSCGEDYCTKPGLRSPSFVKCNIDHLAKPLLTIGIKAGLVFFLGVPAMAAGMISSGVASAALKYKKTKNTKKALTAGVISGVTSGVGSSVISGESKGTQSSGKLGGSLGIAFGLAKAGVKCADKSKRKCQIKTYPCAKEVFNYKYTNVPYHCEIPCQVNVIKDTIATPCCQKVSCASRIKALKCTEKNTFCRIAREKAFSKLNAAKQNILKPVMEFNQAKKALYVAEIEVAKSKLDLEAALTERDILRRAHDAIVKTATFWERSNKQSRVFIQDAIALAQLWNSTNGTSPVDIKEISFDVTLSSPSETQIPVLFRIASMSKEKTVFPIVDFADLNESLKQTAKQIVKELFGNVNVVLRSGHPLNQLETSKGKGRRKRAIDERGSDVTTLVEFKKKCALVTNYNRALSDIIGTLYNISTESIRLLNNVTNNTSEQQHAGSHDYFVNLTQAAELGLSDKDINDSANAVPSDEEVINAVSLIELRNATNHKNVQTAIDMVFRDWEASMETVFNRTSLECSGFIDCMEDFVDNLLFLYQGIDLPEAIRMRRLIAIIGQEVKSLFSYENLSVSEAAEKSSRILKMLKDVKDINLFCAVAPNITQNPVATKNLKIGQTLELSCKASADPVPSYRWRKNGVLLPESNTETLRIEKVTKNDSGNYTCEAYNHLKVEQSTPSYIAVHVPPVMVYQPPSNMSMPVNTGFLMGCKANSLAKPIRYQWLYKPFSGDSYSLVPGGNFSVLNFYSVQKNREGFYKCNVSNPFDYTLSRGVRLRVLGFSLVVPSLGLSFEIAGDDGSLYKAYEKSKSTNNGNKKLHVNDNFQQDVELGLIVIVNNLVNLPSNAMQNLLVENCEMIDGSSNVSCKV